MALAKSSYKTKRFFMKTSSYLCDINIQTTDVFL